MKSRLPLEWSLMCRWEPFIESATLGMAIWYLLRSPAGVIWEKMIFCVLKMIINAYKNNFFLLLFTSYNICYVNYLIRFQSTPLYEGRLFINPLFSHSFSVSIHAPVRGATSQNEIW